jgi:hypothetical protein
METMARDSRRQRDRRSEPVRITTAGTSPGADLAARQRRYILSMSIRSLCFVGAIVAALIGIGWLWPILIAAALILPYVAVVMANNAANGSDGFDLLDTRYDAHELGAGSGAAGPADRP